MKIVDLSVLNKLVDELNKQAAEALKAKDSNNALEYVVEISKMHGLISVVHQESNILASEIMKVYAAASGEAMNLPAPGSKPNATLKGLIDILPVATKNPDKKN